MCVCVLVCVTGVCSRLELMVMECGGGGGGGDFACGI